MNIEFQPNLGGHPERMKEQGIKVHGNELAKIGETLIAIANISDEIPNGKKLTIADIIIEPKDSERGFLKRVVFQEVNGEYNPQKFRKESK